MIRSRQVSIILAVVMGFLAVCPSGLLAFPPGRQVLIGDAVGGGPPANYYYDAFSGNTLVPLIGMVIPVALLSRSGNRLAAFGAGCGTFALTLIVTTSWAVVYLLLLWRP